MIGGVMFARGSMVTGKLFLLFSLVVLGGCAGTEYKGGSTSATSSVVTHYKPVNSMLQAGINLATFNYYRLPKHLQRKQEQAVYHALNHLENGETTYWHDDNSNDRGAVHVTMTYPQGGGYCRVLMTQVSYRGKIRDYTEKACINNVENTWRFIR